MANALRPAIVETKLMPPQPACSWLARPHLLSQMERLRSSKLALLLAPAGCGKTTLLAQWVQQLLSASGTQQPAAATTSVAISWLTLEAVDNEPARFFYCLLAAIKRALPDFQGYLFSHLDGDETMSDAMVDGLLDQLAALPCELIIVLDDAQYIDAPPIASALKRMLQLLPANCHLVWCSRNLPPFGLSALKLEQSLWQLTPEQLRFTQQDIVALNTALSGASISDDDSRHLHDITEGWIAGVKLALLTNHNAEALGTSLREFNGAHHDVMDYLADAVLSQLTPDQQTFLLDSSILSRLNSTLCDHVLDRSDSSAQLQWLTANQLFIQPLDATHQWLRYHALFREFLENRLRVKAPERLSLLHARAAQWFLQQQDFDSALQHAQTSNDAQLWIRTLAVAWNEWIKQGEFNRILRWSEALDDAMLDANTQVLSPMIAALIFARRFNQAAYYLERLADATGNQTTQAANDDGDLAPSDPPNTPPKNIHDDPLAAAQFLRDMLELFQNDNAFRGNRELSLRDPQRGTDLYSFTLAMRAYYFLLNHDFTAAMRQADSARVYLQTAGQSYLASYATLIQILVDRAEGRMLDALTRTENAYNAVRDVRNPEWVNIATAQAVVRYEQNQLDDAAELCRELLPHLSSACATEVVTAVYATLARVQFARGASREAHALLNHVSRILALGHYDRFSSHIVFEKARMAYINGDQRELDLTARNARLLERFRSGEWRKPRSYDECWQRHGQALVYCLFARRALDDARGVLENLIASADRAGCIARFVALQAMLALCFDMQQQGAQAQQCLQLAIERGGWACFNRSVFDEAVGIAQLLNNKFSGKISATHKRALEVPDAFVELFHDVLRQPTVVPQQQLWTEPLTTKEAEIVEFLVAGLSNKDISERADIAITTTKWHLKNIYGKLRVQNRMQALQKLELG